jgi:hypothetical protein
MPDTELLALQRLEAVDTVDKAVALKLENIDEAVAIYFAGVYVELVSVVQAFALYSPISQNVIQVPAWVGWNWAYFLRGLTVFLLAMALWHRYVTQLAYIAALHWLHTFFPFVLGVLQFMLANPHVLKPSDDRKNLAYFMLLMSVTAFTGVLAYTNAYFQHRRNRTKICFAVRFKEDAKPLYEFWRNLHIFSAVSMLVAAIAFLVLSAIANWGYAPSEEIGFPLITTCVAALSIYMDGRFCAKHTWAQPLYVRNIYRKVYGTGLRW